MNQHSVGTVSYARMIKTKQSILDACDRDAQKNTREIITGSLVTEGTTRQYLREMVDDKCLKLAAVIGQVKFYLKLKDTYTPPSNMNKKYHERKQKLFNFIPYKANQVVIKHEVPAHAIRHIEERSPTPRKHKTGRVFVSGNTLAGIV